MKENLQKIIEQFVDFLMPALTPYEASLYIFFLRNSYMKNNSPEISNWKENRRRKYK